MTGAMQGDSLASTGLDFVPDSVPDTMPMDMLFGGVRGRRTGGRTWRRPLATRIERLGLAMMD